jgi:hypothetical protein
MSLIMVYHLTPKPPRGFRKSQSDIGYIIAWAWQLPLAYFGRLVKAALAAHAREKISGPDQRSPKFLARDTRGAFDKLGHSKAKSKGSFHHSQTP